MITDPNTLLHFSIEIFVPQAITIRPEARAIKEGLEKEGYNLYVYPDPKKERPLITLEPMPTQPAPIHSSESISGEVPDEITTYKDDLAALCALDEIENKRKQKAECYLNIEIHVESNDRVILKPRSK